MEGGQPLKHTCTNRPCGLTTSPPLRASTCSPQNRRKPVVWITIDRPMDADATSHGRRTVKCQRTLRFTSLSVPIAEGTHPIPSRTRKLSPSAPMVLPPERWESRSVPTSSRKPASKTEAGFRVSKRREQDKTAQENRKAGKGWGSLGLSWGRLVWENRVPAASRCQLLQGAGREAARRSWIQVRDCFIPILTRPRFSACTERFGDYFEPGRSFWNDPALTGVSPRRDTSERGEIFEEQPQPEDGK